MTLWTFLDAGVLIVGARGEDEERQRALEILEDPQRSFVASSFLYLEVGPKAAFHKRMVETAFYDRFFQGAKWVRDLERIDDLARSEAVKHGLGAMDALHLAAAHLSGAEEFITTEKRSKPIYRSGLVKVVYLFQSS